MIERIILAVITLGFYFGALAASESVLEAKKLPSPEKYKPPLYGMSRGAVKLATLNHPEVYDHYVSEWIGHVIFVSETAKEDARDITLVLNNIAQAGPVVEFPYIMSCIMMTKILEKGSDCDPILRAGLKNVPTSWFIPALYASVLKEQGADPKEVAAMYYLAAAAPDSPANFKRDAMKIRSHNDLSDEDIQNTLNAIFNSEEFERLRKKLH